MSPRRTTCDPKACGLILNCRFRQNCWLFYLRNYFSRLNWLLCLCWLCLLLRFCRTPYVEILLLRLNYLLWLNLVQHFLLRRQSRSFFLFNMIQKLDLKILIFLNFLLFDLLLLILRRPLLLLFLLFKHNFKYLREKGNLNCA